MKFCWSTLRVRNIDESIKFYQDIVGLGLAARFRAGQDTEIAFLGAEPTQIELICDGKGDINIGSDISWGFEVPSLQEKMDYLTDQGIDIDGPYSPNPVTSFCFIKDPDGLRIQFVETKKS